MPGRTVSVGVIGCGSFARHMHLPRMRSDGRYRIHAACDVDEARAEAVAREYGCAYHTSDVERVLGDDDVELVMITTRHDTHADLSIRAARAGKHILCEKPMGLTIEECRAVYRAVRESGLRYTIGYNRSVAPLVQRARDRLMGIGRPFIIYHRMQNYIPDHWLLEATGGGRLIGEGCHVFDMFCVLAGADPVRISGAGGVFTGNPRAIVPDTAAVTMAFANGVAATMIVSSVGCNNGLSKEWTEIYCRDTAITIDDFRVMTVHSPAVLERTELPAVDKGHQREIALLADALLDGGPEPNDVVQAMRAAVCALKADEAIRTGATMTLSRSDYVLDA